jgi:hypothetical protein
MSAMRWLEKECSGVHEEEEADFEEVAEEAVVVVARGGAMVASCICHWAAGERAGMATGVDTPNEGPAAAAANSEALAGGGCALVDAAAAFVVDPVGAGIVEDDVDADVGAGAGAVVAEPNGAETMSEESSEAPPAAAVAAAVGGGRRAAGLGPSRFTSRRLDSSSKRRWSRLGRSMNRSLSCGAN